MDNQLEKERKKTLHRIGILNQVVDDIYKKIPNLIQEDNFLDNAEKCVNLLDKVYTINHKLIESIS